MPRKVTKKRLKELAEDTNLQLNKYYCEEISKNIRSSMNMDSIHLRDRLIRAGVTLQKAKELRELLEPYLVRSLGSVLNGWSTSFDDVIQYILAQLPEIKQIENEQKYVRFSENELELFKLAQEVIDHKLGSEYRLRVKDTSTYRGAEYETQVFTEVWERPDYVARRALPENDRYQAASTELAHLLQKSLVPATQVLSTRVRRHGPKMTFGYVDAMIDSCSECTEAEAVERFKTVLDQVDNSLQQFINLIVNPPELLALSVDLKSTSLQAQEEQDDYEDYLEIS